MNAVGIDLVFAAQGTAASALLWWQDAGVDWELGDKPCDWLAPVLDRTSPRIEPRVPIRASVANAPALERAETLARSADSPAALAAAHRELFGAHALFYEGDPANDLWLALAAPDPLAHARGELMAGDAGLLLTSMLRSIGRTRDTACLLSLAPGPADPAAVNAMTHPFVRRLADLVQPAAIVTLGSDATAALLAARSGVGRLRGRFGAFPGFAGEHPFLPTFHPALLVAQPAQKAAAWSDLLTVKAKLAA